MKIYLTNYDLSKRAGKTIYASQYSSFKAGIKVPGASDIKLFDGQTEISADASLFHGYKAFPLDAGDVGQKEYTVKADGSELKLKVVSTDSTAAELNDKDTVFDLPIATAETLGGVKVGPGLSVGEDGTLSASGGSIPADLSVDTLYSAKSIKLDDPEIGGGVFISCDSYYGMSKSHVNLPDFQYTAESTGTTEAYLEIGNVSMGYGLRFQETLDGALTCEIASNGLTSEYVSTMHFSGAAIDCQDDGSGGEIAVFGREDYGMYVKYDSQNSEMVGSFTELTCGQDAEFRQNVTIDGTLAVGSSIRTINGAGQEEAELAYDGLTFTDGSGTTEVFTPITVTIGGLQYRLLGYAV